MTWQSFRKRAMEISEVCLHLGVGLLLISLAWLVACVGWWLVH